MAHAWWAEAYDYAVKAENLLSTSWHPGKVPGEVWSGKKQIVGHLDIWGSTCYAKILVGKGHSKLSPRGQKGRFIRLVDHGMYQIVLNDIPGNKIIVSCDVIFKELPPMCTASSHEEENNEPLLQLEEMAPIKNPQLHADL